MTPQEMLQTFDKISPSIRLWIEVLRKYAVLFQGIGSIATALGVIGGFIWTLRELRNRRRIQSAETVSRLYERFYQIDQLDMQDRIDFEYNFFSTWAPIMEKWLVYPDSLSANDNTVLAHVDALLNFFEHVAYFTRARSELLSKADQKAVFDYWFNTLMWQDSHAVLRLYLTYSFEELSKHIGMSPTPVYLAVYGTLMTEVLEGPQKIKDIMKSLKSHGPCHIPGDLYVVGPNKEYPGLVPSASKNSAVPAELIQIAKKPADAHAADVLQALDSYEGFDPNDAIGSEYVRRFMMVRPKYGFWRRVYDRFVRRSKAERLRVGAWVYVYNRKIDRDKALKISDWKSYKINQAGEHNPELTLRNSTAS